MHHLRTYKLAVEFYAHAKAIELPHYLKDQLRRAALSIGLNLRLKRQGREAAKTKPQVF